MAKIAERFRSPSIFERYEALLQWQSTIKGNSSKDAVTILLDVLQKENRLFETTLLESGGKVAVGDKYGEEYAEYYKELLETVARVANREEPRVVETIVSSTFSPGWDVALELVQKYPNRVLTVVLEKARSPFMFRRYEGLDLAAIIRLVHCSIKTGTQNVFCATPRGLRWPPNGWASCRTGD
jgi:hypothetical protein